MLIFRVFTPVLKLSGNILDHIYNTEGGTTFGKVVFTPGPDFLFGPTFTTLTNSDIKDGLALVMSLDYVGGHTIDSSYGLQMPWGYFFGLLCFYNSLYYGGVYSSLDVNSAQFWPFVQSFPDLSKFMTFLCTTDSSTFNCQSTNQLQDMLIYTTLWLFQRMYHDEDSISDIETIFLLVSARLNIGDVGTPSGDRQTTHTTLSNGGQTLNAPSIDQTKTNTMVNSIITTLTNTVSVNSKILSHKSHADTFTNTMNSLTNQCTGYIKSNRNNIIVLSSLILFLGILALSTLTINTPWAFVESHKFTLVFSILALGLVLSIFTGFLFVYLDTGVFFHTTPNLLLAILFGLCPGIVYFIFGMGHNIFNVYASKTQEAIEKVQSESYLFWIASAICLYLSIFYIMLIEHMYVNIMLVLSIALIGPLLVFIARVILGIYNVYHNKSRSFSEIPQEHQQSSEIIQQTQNLSPNKHQEPANNHHVHQDPEINLVDQ